ncbi:hypothetical protein [Paraliomyxa miuraensis]|uniref:hypothetical protein n=1 Tax=Paraliomyxa miuraensis TaxID=376150 RepID=UPI00225A62BC|nr:hypothetical protein [Paraliomyxa miuraensis]MCX4244791.1 hypothetical protein [Paraliomyxa miuraensis]
MSDELLQRLGRVERESRPAEEWDEVLEGRMTALEAVERGRARGEEADELEARARASAPLSETERKAWTRRARAALAKDAEDEPHDDAPQHEPEPESEPESAAPDAPVDLARERERRRAWLLGLSTLVIMAAALVLWIQVQPVPRGLETTPEPLPSFSLFVRNDLPREVRGADEGPAEGPPRYRSDSQVHWSIQPEAPIAGAVELAAIVRGDDDLACLARPVVARTSTDGILEVRGTVSDTLGLGAGHWTLELLVARAGALPVDEPGARCTSPRHLPCPCPRPLEQGASIEAAVLEPAREPAAWRTVDAYEMLVDAS